MIAVDHEGCYRETVDDLCQTFCRLVQGNVGAPSGLLAAEVVDNLRQQGRQQFEVAFVGVLDDVVGDAEPQCLNCDLLVAAAGEQDDGQRNATFQ